MSFLTLPDGRQMAYSLSSSPASGSIVLLSNSLCEDYTSWDRVAAVIEGIGLRVLRYDQPGHGRSSSPMPDKISAMNFETMADDVAFLINSLGITRLHAWIGVSMGGIKGIYFATRHRGIINKLLVADAIVASPNIMGLPDVFTSRVMAAKVAKAMKEDLVNTRKRWFGDEWMAANPEETARMTKAMATTTIEGLEACCAALSNPSFDLRPLYYKVGEGCDEALIVAGEKDADLPVKMQEMRSRLDGSLKTNGKRVPVEMKIVKNAGHVPYVDGFQEFCEILKKYLE